MITFSIIGLTFILKYGTILQKLRQYLCKDNRVFQEFFKCSMCIGAWSGLFVGLLETHELSFIYFLYGSAVSFFADNVLDLIQTACNRLERN